MGKDDGNGGRLKSSSAVWEEALEQEFIYAIGHLNHVEQHLIEADSSIELPIFSPLVNEFRELRKLTGQVLFNVESIKSEKGGKEQRNAWESIWCALKHSSTALIHLDECIEKMIREISYLKSEKERVEWMQSFRTLLDARRRTMEGIMSMIKTGKENSDLIKEAEVRCREDLCLEEMEKNM